VVNDRLSYERSLSSFLSPARKEPKEAGQRGAERPPLSAAPRAAFGGCALHAPAGAAPREPLRFGMIATGNHNNF